MIRKDLERFGKIFAIDPSYGSQNGCGWAVFCEDTGRLKRCGIVRPFAPGGPARNNMNELLEKLQRVWEKEVGFSCHPLVLCIEYPQIYRIPGMVNPNILLNLAFFCGLISSNFGAKRDLSPRPSEWKGNLSKDKKNQQIAESLDRWSKKALERDLAATTKHLRHNVIDAVGLGLFAIKNLKHQNL